MQEAFPTCQLQLYGRALLLQVRMEKELAPLLAALEDARKKVASEKKVPSYGTLKEWAQARADALTIAARGARRGDGTLTPAQVEVDLSGSLLSRVQPPVTVHVKSTSSMCYQKRAAMCL